MKGISGKPFIDCRDFVDIQTLNDLILEICLGIATSDIKAGVYGPGVAEPEKFGNFMKLKNKMENSEEFKSTWTKLTHNQQNIFAKLYFNLYNPSTTVYLREPKKDSNQILAYLKKSKSELFTWTKNVENFPKLKIWLDQLMGPVFEQYGRIIFFIHEHDCQLLLHRDGVAYAPHHNEFLWINPMEVKKFYIYDEDTDTRHYVDSPVVFFNDLDMHGGDVTSSMTWSLRIDGVFSEEFRRKLNLQDIKFY
jgi:hypothetical protein